MSDLPEKYQGVSRFTSFPKYPPPKIFESHAPPCTSTLPAQRPATRSEAKKSQSLQDVLSKRVVQLEAKLTQQSLEKDTMAEVGRLVWQLLGGLLWLCSSYLWGKNWMFALPSKQMSNDMLICFCLFMISRDNIEKNIKKTYNDSPSFIPRVQFNPRLHDMCLLPPPRGAGEVEAFGRSYRGGRTTRQLSRGPGK